METPISWAKTASAHPLLVVGHVGATNSIPLTLPSGSLTNAIASPDMSSTVGSLARMMGNLAIVFAVLIGALWLYRYWQRLLVQRAPAGGLRVVDAKNLGQRMGVYVVAYRHQQFLIGVSPSGVSLLSPLDPDPAAVTASPSAETGASHSGSVPPGSFRSILDKTLTPSA